jgi:RHS repeat-associated protein
MAGQQYDQGSELYYMRARYYDPQLGRFLSEDPIGISGGLNLYAYAGNDPVNKTDPAGMSVECGNVLYLYTTSYVDTGEITDMWYGTENECHDVPDEGDKGGGPGDAGETMGRAPTDSTCRVFGIAIPGLRSLLKKLGGHTIGLGFAFDAFAPQSTRPAPGVTGAAGLYANPSGIGIYLRGGSGAGLDGSLMLEFVSAPTDGFFGSALELQGQVGPVALSGSRSTTYSGSDLFDGWSVQAGWPLGDGGVHLAFTGTSDRGRIIKCD